MCYDRVYDAYEKIMNEGGKEMVVSLIVPCYNEQDSLVPFMHQVTDVLRNCIKETAEIILVDDGSDDDTLMIIRRLCEVYPECRYISFSRNFGKESAILAGFVHSKGQYVAVMDADLQDPPALLVEMLKAVREEGYDCAGTRRITRQGEPFIRSVFARLFYWLINHMSTTRLPSGARDYKLLSRKAVDALLSMPEINRFSKGLYEWIGFRTKWIEYENVARVAGVTKWSFWKLFKYSIEGIVSFSTLPLALSSLVGVVFMFISLFMIVILVVRQFVWHNSVDGWTSLVCILLMLSGLQLLSVGIMGQYMAKMYLEIKGRPHYIINEMK